MSENENKTFELCYNSACILIAKGKYVEAKEKLIKAESMCIKTFEDDPDEQETLEKEVSVIRLVIFFVFYFNSP
jgi:hypothetical protein